MPIDSQLLYGKTILDVCCGSRMFWFDKTNPMYYLLILDMKHIHFAMDGH